MPKVDDDYTPKWKYARIRSREAEFVEQVAEQYQERFIDALYRIINFYRDAHLDTSQKQAVIKDSKPKPKSKPEPTEEIDIDTSLFD